MVGCVKPSEENQCFPPPRIPACSSCTATSVYFLCIFTFLFFKDWAWSWVFKQPKKLHGKITRLLCLGIPISRPVTLHRVSALLPMFSRLWWIKGPVMWVFFIFYTWCKLLFLTLLKFADSNRGRLWKAWQEMLQLHCKCCVSPGCVTSAAADLLGNACVVGCPSTYNMLTFSWCKFYYSSIWLKVFMPPIFLGYGWSYGDFSI